jgi:hypothetical protein
MLELKSESGQFFLPHPKCIIIIAVIAKKIAPPEINAIYFSSGFSQAEQLHYFALK